MKLFDLAAEYREAADTLADLDLPEDVVRDTLESISGDLTTKAQNVALLITDWKGSLATIKAYEESVASRRKALETRVKSIERFLLDAMTLANVQKIDGPRITVRVQANPTSVEILDPAEIPPSFMRVIPQPPPEIDKRSIKEALEGGHDVPGARLMRGFHLRIK